MAYQTIPLSVVGPTSQNKSQQANSALTKNWYPEITIDGRSNAALLPWPGTVAFGTAPSELDRGLHVFRNVLYHVNGDALYSVSSSGVYTKIGDIAGFSRCIFDDNGVEMAITADGNAYSFNGVVLIKGDAAEFANTESVTMLNNTFLYNAELDNFFVSEAGDALNFRAAGSAESKGDDLLRPYAFSQWVYMLGETTNEPWWNAAADTLGFDRIDGGIMEKGLGGLYTVANTDQFMYFLGDDANVYQVIQSSIKLISTPEISFQLGKLNIGSAVGWTMVLDGQDFFILNFDDDDLSYAYSEQTDSWFNLSSGVDNGRYIGSSYARVYNKHISVDFSTGNTIEITDQAFDDIGQTLQRQRTLPPINSSKLGMGAGKRLLMSKAKFMLQTGQGLASGQGSDPAIEIEFSIDGGATWEVIDWPKVGKLGQYLINVEAWNMVSFYDIQFRLTMSDPVFSSLHDGSIDLKLAGY